VQNSCYLSQKGLTPFSPFSTTTGLQKRVKKGSDPFFSFFYHNRTTEKGQKGVRPLFLRVVPTVLFTRREKWKKAVARELESRLGDRVFLHFEYQLVRLFDYEAQDHYDVPNPVVKILLPKMHYRPEERGKVIRKAWVGLYQLTSLAMFDKYVDFIDTYAAISEDEKEALLKEITEEEDTVMLAQHIKEKGIQEGVILGREEGVILGRQEGVVMGRQEGIRAMVMNASRQGLPEDMIARIAGLDVASVKKILNHEKVDIPLDKLGLDS